MIRTVRYTAQGCVAVHWLWRRCYGGGDGWKEERMEGRKELEGIPSDLACKRFPQGQIIVHRIWPVKNLG